jgi:hypothetical protein
MPLLFIEVHLNDDVVVDEWLWFPNLEAAQREAEDIKAEIVRETGVENVRILISDQHSQPD